MREDPFEVLGLHRTASQYEIKDAYRILCKKWHPDMHSDPVAKQHAEGEFKRVQQAYSLVSGRDRSAAAVNYYAQHAWNAAPNKQNWTNKQFSLYLLGLSVAGGAFGIWWSRMVGERDSARRASFEMHQAEQRGALPGVRPRPRPSSSGGGPGSEAAGRPGEEGGLRPERVGGRGGGPGGLDEATVRHPVNIHRRHTQQLRQWRMTYSEEEVEQLRELRWQQTKQLALQEAGKGALMSGSGMGVVSLCVRAAKALEVAPFTRIPSLLTRTPSLCFYVSGAAAAGFFIRGHQTASPRGSNHVLLDNVEIELGQGDTRRDTESR